MIGRRAFLAAAAATCLATPRIVAGQAGKGWRIGLLMEGPNFKLNPELPSNRFVESLRDLGYIEGQNLVLEYRYADNKRNEFQGSRPNSSG